VRRGLLSRRTLLRGAGSAAVGLPVLDAMLTLGGRLPCAHAASGLPPRRLVIFFTGEGFPMNEWRPIAGASPTEFRLSEFLAPLEPVRRQSLFIEGVPMTSSFDPKQQAQGHPAGAQAILTGAWAGPGNQYGGGCGKMAGFSPYPSIDHLIAKGVGAATRFPAYYLGVAAGGPSPASRPFVGDDQKGIAVQSDPRAAFDQLFADFSGGNAGATLAAAQKRRADERKAVIDSVLGDFQGLRCQLGGEDRRRLDGHMNNLSEIGMKVSVPSPAIDGTCAKPARPDAADRSFAAAQSLTARQLDLTAAALACDLTRVVCLSLSRADADNGAVYRWLGHTSDHHNISHLMGADPRPKLVQIGAWHSEQILSLAKRLQGVAEPNGTLWDNTTILWISELGNGWTHDRRAPAFMLFGGGQGYFRMGRYLKLGGANGYGHGRLLTHLLNYMGVNAAAVGPAEYNVGGPLPDIAA
jgi:hypothetical protein